MKNKTTNARAPKLIRKIRRFMIRNCNTIFLVIASLIMLLVTGIATNFVDFHRPLIESKNAFIAIGVLSLVDALVYLRYYNWMTVFGSR